MHVLVIDYGMGNLASVVNALKAVGAKPFISSDPMKLKEATHAVLPGQGAFKDGMQALRQQGWVEALKEYVLQRPLLGICLGMQLLADRSYEGEETQGLGLISGEVVKLSVRLPQERLPHVGWNSVHFVKENVWLQNIINGSDFYFVHSYHFKAEKNAILGSTDYGNETFASMVGGTNLMGVQFHPEKSAQPGRQLLKNFVDRVLC